MSELKRGESCPHCGGHIEPLGGHVGRTQSQPEAVIKNAHDWRQWVQTMDRIRELEAGSREAFEALGRVVLPPGATK